MRDQFVITDKIVIIHDWQEYLCRWRSIAARPQFIGVPDRSRRYGKAQNVCMWTPSMIGYLKAESLSYTVVDPY